MTESIETIDPKKKRLLLELADFSLLTNSKSVADFKPGEREELLKECREARRGLLPYDRWLEKNPDGDGAISEIFGSPAKCYQYLERTLDELEMALDVQNHH